VQGTCQWFLSQEGYTQWLAEESGILLVTADPGCGKSVLSKYLIDHQLQPATIYFFFKDQDQNTVRQALCALLHQLFIKKPFLIKHAIDEHSNSGENMINNTISLWRIFDKVFRDPQAGPVIIVLDALDECAEPELRDLTEGLIRHFKTEISDGPQSGCKLKVLLTSRPYKLIVNQLQKLLNSFTGVRIPGEQYSEAIGKEVNLVIEKRVEQLQLTEALQESEKRKLKKRLMDRLCGIPNRTYLWVHLVFEQLENEGLEKETEKGVDSFIAMPPRDLPETYTRILQKCTDPKKTRMAKAILLAAQRPLFITEFNVAINVRSDHQGFEDLDLEPDEVFASKLPSLCGLLISIHHEKVYFLHQTAREFLMESSSIGPEFLFKDFSSIKAQSDQNWHHSISLRYAHTVLAEQCVFYLKLWNAEEHDHRDDKDPLDYYASSSWAHHIKEANLDQNASVIPAVIKICQPDSNSFKALKRLYRAYGGYASSQSRLVVCVASYYGLRAVVEKLWTTGKAEIDSKDDMRRTPLYYAVSRGEVAMVQWLLETNKVDVNSQDIHGNTLLMAAASRAHSAIFKLLLDTGKIGVNLKDRSGDTALKLALKLAAKGEREAIIRLLINTQEVDINSKDRTGSTALHWAVFYRDKAIIKLLLGTKQADINIKDVYGKTALELAEERKKQDIAELIRSYIA
jgi:ankyrin repeat protein